MSLKKYTIITPRLGLRNWQESDITPMSLLNQDKKVMEFFPATPTLEQTENFIRRMQAQFEKTGYCYYAVDRLDTGNFIGFIGICLLYTSPSPRDQRGSRMPSSA